MVSLRLLRPVFNNTTDMTISFEADPRAAGLTIRARKKGWSYQRVEGLWNWFYLGLLFPVTEKTQKELDYGFYETAKKVKII